MTIQAPVVHDFPTSCLPAVNVAQVPQRSPLRYPGGKTWLIPHVRAWLQQVQPTLLVEPFCGGGTASLTAVMEGLVERCVMLDLDPDVAAFWHAVLREGEALAQRIEAFEPTRERVEALTCTVPASVLDHGFRTLVLNRTRRSGILAPGAALIRQGEKGQGLGSRWYPDTLGRRHPAGSPLPAPGGLSPRRAASGLFSPSRRGLPLPKGTLWLCCRPYCTVGGGVQPCLSIRLTRPAANGRASASMLITNWTMNGSLIFWPVAEAPFS